MSDEVGFNGLVIFFLLEKLLEVDKAVPERVLSIFLLFFSQSDFYTLVVYLSKLQVIDLCITILIIDWKFIVFTYSVILPDLFGKNSAAILLVLVRKNLMIAQATVLL